MKNNILRIVLLLSATMATMAAQAQSGLHIEDAFNEYGQRKGCKMVTMQDATLRGYRLHIYKSLTYKRLGREVDSLLTADREQARKIREVIDNGHISSGYYEMAPTQGGFNRFVLYSRRSPQEGTIIYIEGTLTADDIMRLCYAKW